jgi:hypothetical protein
VAGQRATGSSRPKVGAGMSTPFFNRILQACCRHQFSWPHTGVHGQDYQVCLLCGVAYEYDLTTMRRTRRLAPPEENGNQPLSGRHA